MSVKARLLATNEALRRRTTKFKYDTQFTEESIRIITRCSDPRFLREMSVIYITPDILSVVQTAARSVILPERWSCNIIPFQYAMLYSGEHQLVHELVDRGENPRALINLMTWVMSSERTSVTAVLWDGGLDSRYTFAPAFCAAFREGARQDDHEIDIVKFQFTLWTLMNQRIAVKEDVPSNRAFRRRHGSDAIPTVTLMRLRRPSNADGSESASSPVDWSHRWVVGGHWRNQFRPSTQDHLPTWIAPYIKGPEDKPLVLKDRVYTFVR